MKTVHFMHADMLVMSFDYERVARGCLVERVGHASGIKDPGDLYYGELTPKRTPMSASVVTLTRQFKASRGRFINKL